MRASYRLAAKTFMRKVVQKVGWELGHLNLQYNILHQVATKLSVSPASLVLTAEGEVVEGGQEAASYWDKIVTAHLMIDYDMEPP